MIQLQPHFAFTNDTPYLARKSEPWGIFLEIFKWIWPRQDDVIKWKHFPRYWPFVPEIHQSPVNSPQKGQRRGALMFSLICVWINGWANKREAGDLRRYRAHCDVTVMIYRQRTVSCLTENITRYHATILTSSLIFFSDMAFWSWFVELRYSMMT